MRIPPLNYGAVVPGSIYRCSYPEPENYEFIKDLKIKSILTLVPEKFPDDYQSFMDSAGIQHFRVHIRANKGEVRVESCEMQRALRLVMDRTNHPIMIHCNKGKHRTGCTIACFRRICGLDMDTIREEYHTYAGKKARFLDEVFFENFDINSVFDKVRSPQHDQQTFLQRRQSSMHMQDKPQAAVDDADVDRLLKDEDNDVEMSGYSSDPTVCWQGSINMQSMEPFDAVARFVAGGDFGQIVPWEKLLTNIVAIQGRIESTKGNDYIQNIGHTESHEVSILAISPVTTDGRTIMDHLYEYFHSRGRWGVVPVEGNDILRDLYVIPIEEGGSNLPPFIDMLEYCTIETPRKEHMLILAMVAKLPEVKPQLPPTQHFERYPEQDIAAGQAPQPVLNNGPSPFTNPHAPQMSPVSAAYPQGQYGNPFAAPPANMVPIQQPTPPINAPPHHQIPKALEILGPYIDSPVIVTILGSSLSQNSAVSELQMLNLRHIVETVPEARDNITVLTNHLRSKNESNGQQQAQPSGPP